MRQDLGTNGGGACHGIERNALMNASFKKRAMIAIAVAAVLAGVIVAIAAPGRDHAPVNSAANSAGGAVHGELAVAASYLGLTGAQLRGDLESGQTLAEVASATKGKSTAGLTAAIAGALAANLHAAVAAGRLSKAQGSLALAKLHTLVTAAVNRPRRAVAAGNVRIAASYLGLSRARIRSEQQHGRSLAQIAEATPGKSAAGLIDALVSRRHAAIAAASARGEITRTEEDRLLSTLRERMTAQVNHSPSAGAGKASGT